MTAAAPRVVVAVLTYRRPEDLREVLPEVAAQCAAQTAAGTPSRVLVVDNDPDGSALPEVAALGLAGVDVVHEPEPGIAAARNRALDVADEAGEDVLVFLDDDERPCEGWLGLLLATWRSERCGAVVGPVVSRFPGEPAPWVHAGGFFTRRRLATGTRVDVAATNNLLLDLARVRAAAPGGLRFDARFGVSGGSDTLFTRLLHTAGAELVWCDEAVVTDVVPVSRTTRGWVLRRQLRSGNSHARVEVVVAPSAPARVLARSACAGRGLLRVVAGAGGTVAGTVRGDTSMQARGAKALARGTGMLGGALGWTYAEYRRPAATTPPPAVDGD